MKKKINVVNQKEMKISSFDIPQLFYVDKLISLGDNVFLYNEPLDEYLHNKGIILCAAIQINFGGDIKNVVLYDSALLKLPDHVQEMFVRHEVGHFVNGDINNLSPSDATKIIIKRIFGLTPKMEYNADKYAASVIGISKAKSALSFMINKTNIPFHAKIELIKRYYKIK